MTDIHVDLLSNKPEFLDCVVDHLWQEWQRDYIEFIGIKDKTALRRYFASTSFFYVASRSDVLLGCALVDKDDIGIRPDLTPWLASIYTMPNSRHQGIAAMLIQYVLNRHPLLHLCCISEQLASYYEKHGFQVIDRVAEYGHLKNVIVMRNLPHHTNLLNAFKN